MRISTTTFPDHVIGNLLSKFPRFSCLLLISTLALWSCTKESQQAPCQLASANRQTFAYTANKWSGGIDSTLGAYIVKYDGGGNITAIDYPNLSIAFAYTGDGRQVVASFAYNGGPVSQISNYQFNAAKQLTLLKIAFDGVYGGATDSINTSYSYPNATSRNYQSSVTKSYYPGSLLNESVSFARYVYDNHLNPLQANSLGATDNNLMSVTTFSGSDSSVIAMTRYVYMYNHLGYPVSCTTYSNTGDPVFTKFLYTNCSAQ